MKSLKSAALAISLMCLSMSAQAISIQVDFTASGFPAGAPDDPVSGSFVYDAASTTSTINSVVSVNLTINGHSYTLAEVGSDFNSSNNVIGGLINGATAVSSGTPNDFRLIWDFATMASPRFTYTSSANANYAATSFSQFSISEVTAMPEPGTLWMLLLGFIVITLIRRSSRT